MDEYQVAAGRRRFVDGGRVVVHRVAHFVGGCGFDELPNSTAHNGMVVNNKESGTTRAGHGRGNLLRFVSKDNTEMYIFTYFYT